MRVYIRRDVLHGILQAAERHYPNEFFCLLGGRFEGDSAYVEEIVYVPFKNSRRSVVFDVHHIPMDERIIGSAHSHPYSSGPSGADLRTFIRTGWVHLIVYPPFSEESVSAYDGKGRRVELIVV